MKKLGLALVSFFVLSHAQAEAPIERNKGIDPDAYARDVMRTENWTQVVNRLRGVIPSNVVKEFEVAVKDLPFPEMRYFRGEFTFVDHNGKKTRLKLVADGSVQVNGKEWALKPLQTTEKEIQRMNDLVDGKGKPTTSSMNFLFIPEAVAADKTGITAFQHAVATGFVAEKCGEAGVSKKIRPTCVLMGVGIDFGGRFKKISYKRSNERGLMHAVAHAESANSCDQNLNHIGQKFHCNMIRNIARSVLSPRKYLPVELKCPSFGNGELSLQYKNSEGNVRITTVRYKSFQATSVKLTAKDKGQSTEIVYDGKYPSQDEAVQFSVELVEPAMKQVCSSGDAGIQNRYQAFLEANKSDLRATNENELKNASDPTMEAI